MLHKIRRIVLVALLVIISACQSQPITYYTPPAGLPQQESATIVGSKVLVPNIFYADEITYVLAIDGLPLEGGSKNHDIPTQLSPGKHVVRVGFVQGTGCAEATFELNVHSGQRYIARGKKLGRESIFRQEDLRIWLEDSEGHQVTDDVVVPFGYCGGGFGIIIA